MSNPQEDRPILNAIFDDLGAMRDEDRTFQKEVLDRLLRIEKRLASLEGTEGVLIEKLMEVRVEQLELQRRTLDLERKSTQ